MAITIKTLQASAMSKLANGLTSSAKEISGVVSEPGTIKDLNKVTAQEAVDLAVRVMDSKTAAGNSTLPCDLFKSSGYSKMNLDQLDSYLTPSFLAQQLRAATLPELVTVSPSVFSVNQAGAAFHQGTPIAGNKVILDGRTTALGAGMLILGYHVRTKTYYTESGDSYVQLRSWCQGADYATDPADYVATLGKNDINDGTSEFVFMNYRSKDNLAVSSSITYTDGKMAWVQSALKRDRSFEVILGDGGQKNSSFELSGNNFVAYVTPIIITTSLAATALSKLEGGDADLVGLLMNTL